MTSTFSSSKSSHSLVRNNHAIELKEIEAKKGTLLALENALKKKISEFRELCLKEGELTGHLPIDYPLQPREPIPQVRRRINNSNISNNSIRNKNLNDQSSITIPYPIRARQQKLNYSSQSQAFAIPSQPNTTAQMQFPSRPTSTNSTSSSISTASSNLNNGNNHNALLYNQHLQGLGNFQPYYEETKPFQMSDFYKYSSKHRAQTVTAPTPQFKTTRQLQEDVLKKNSLKYNSCDDQIQFQNSVKLFEKGGQKLIEATAKAIVGNPSLAEKINNILPTNSGEKY